MNILGSFVIAFSMYSRIPMPQVEWTEERMRYCLCFFPLIGAVIGAAQLSLFAAGWRMGAGPLFTALLGPAIPRLITGGIHMDGYLDVTDARRSYGDREKKLRILKDPHTGAFAIIGLGSYLLLYAGAISELGFQELCLFAVIFVAERALSGLSVVLFPKAKEDGLVAQFSRTAVKRAVGGAMAAYLALSACALLWLGGEKGLVCILTAAVSFYLYYRMSLREFGGITGDLAGYFLQSCERNAAIALALCRLAGL